ncbi:hypothetical protein EDC56_2828 [Sinobacterium caligoides]|uniref:Uncharacterized protein n=1 Tax=Sinobacterium caligoides TaxID=933926 RepID=A0A3N2DK55_9GAMM|nr:hypothetical protein [Sinobacterium caligoides]ROS00191.1 hypothetical protein EDC56_2828 [Sinobacterium caligoides]
MSVYNLKDKDGNEYSISLGAGSQWPDESNLAQCPIKGQAQLERFKPLQLHSAVHFFYHGFAKSFLYRSLAERSTSHAYNGRSDLLPFCPKQALGDAMVHSELILKSVESSSSLQPELAQRALLRVKISNTCHDIIVSEQVYGRLLADLMARESELNKGLIYTGALMSGVGEAAWGLAVWLKDVTDLVNPVVRARHLFRATQAGRGSEHFVASFGESLAASEWRELVEVLGFDPSQLNRQQLQQVMIAAEVIYADASLRGDLERFAKDYADAQHAIEYTNMAGVAVFELLLTLLLLAAGGVGAVANAASKLRQLVKFTQLGELLLAFAESGKKSKRQQSTGYTGTDTVSFEDFEADGEAGGAARPVVAVPAVRRAQPVESTGSNNDRPLEGRVTPNKAIQPSSLVEAKVILANRRKQLEASGYKPKYSDQELAHLAQHGEVGSERFQVRFMETQHLSSHDAPTEHLSGALGLNMQSVNGKGAKYWSTSFDQLEDKDSDPKLISESLGLDYNPNVDYTLVIVDTEKAVPLTGVKSVPATFEKVGEFANTELPDDFTKAFTDKAMTPAFQADYARHYEAAADQGFLESKWSRNTEDFDDYLRTTDMKQADIDDMKLRMLMHDKVGNNQDYLGNGLTKDLNPNSPNQFGAVETLNFERKEVSLKELSEADAIIIMPGLKPL